MSIPFLYKKGRDGRGSSVTVTVDGRTFPVTDDSPHFTAIIDALKNGDDAIVHKLLQLKQHIASFTDGMVTIVNDELFFDGKVLHNALATRIMEMLNDGFNIKPMVAFLHKCMKNPSKTAVEELYLFLEACDLPITEDGDFLAYKVVRHDYKDKYTGTMDNSIGATPKMKREDCNPNRNETCSRGLHFASQSYISTFRQHGDHLMVVKVNPEHVVSIPSDYNNAKGRACQYLIFAEVNSGGDIPNNYVKNDDLLKMNTESGKKLLEQGESKAKTKVEAKAKVKPETKVKPKTKQGAVPVNSSAKLNPNDVRKIRRLLSNGYKVASIAQTFGVHRRTIERIASGEAWGNVV